MEVQEGYISGQLLVLTRGPDKLYTHAGYVQKHPTWDVLCACGKVYNVIGFRLKGKKALMSCRECANRAKQLNGQLSHHYLRRLQISASKRGIYFDLGVTKEYLLGLLSAQNKRCAMSGLDIGFAASVHGEKHGESTASLDRVDNAKGYEVGNVQWLHKDVNRLKGTFDQARVIELARAITQASVDRYDPTFVGGS